MDEMPPAPQSRPPCGQRGCREPNPPSPQVWVGTAPSTPCPAISPKPRRRATRTACGFIIRAEGMNAELCLAPLSRSGSAPGEDVFWSSALCSGMEQRASESTFALLIRLLQMAL